MSSTLSRTLLYRDPTDAKSIISGPTVRGPTTDVPRLWEAQEVQEVHGSVQRSSRIQDASNQQRPRNKTCTGLNNKASWSQDMRPGPATARPGFRSGTCMSLGPGLARMNRRLSLRHRRPTVVAFSGLFDYQFKMQKRHRDPPGRGQGGSYLR